MIGAGRGQAAGRVDRSAANGALTNRLCGLAGFRWFLRTGRQAQHRGLPDCSQETRS